jgi:RimJ/RimL family protein N-acetyltransferase
MKVVASTFTATSARPQKPSRLDFAKQGGAGLLSDRCQVVNWLISFVGSGATAYPDSRSSLQNTAMDFFEPVRIEGTRVTLEPLALRHHDDLAVAGADESIWRWLPSAHHVPGSMAGFIEQALAAHEQRSALPFAIIDQASQKAVGSTRYHHVATEHRRLEIGVTWIGVEFQRTHINTETKLLQLWYALEILKCRRVELKADVDNEKSRAAILRLGARQEGVFRKHMLYADGRNRDNVYFSIVDDEWAAIRLRLEARLGYTVEPTFKKTPTG